jgi:protein-S-isoprenylcysteine O-methyltransferase Ste14
LRPLPFSAGPIFDLIFWCVFASWVVPEIVAWRSKRSKDNARACDRGSLNLIASLWWTGIALDFICALFLPKASINSARMQIFAVGILLMISGNVLRWHSAAVLGKYFTFDVAIQRGQTLIETGPYRFIRHPSYTGALLTLLGFGLVLGNWLGSIAAMICMGIAYGYRIPVEEAALISAIGDAYLKYKKRTWRLIPFFF